MFVSDRIYVTCVYVKDGRTAAAHASETGMKSCMKLLSDVKEGKTALMRAVEAKNDSAMSLLLERGAPIDSADSVSLLVRGLTDGIR